MSAPRCLFVLSADFGEYVTANLFSRAQPFLRHFALPAALAGAARAQGHEMSAYSSVRDLEALVARLRPDLVVLASGYLFAVNNLIAPEELRGFIDRLRESAIAVATTDPWLRVWKLRPEARFRIHSMRLGGEDEAQSHALNRLRERLERDFADVPHLFAVPVPAGGTPAFSFFNPAFAGAGEAAPGASYDDWLFVLSREDLAYLRPQAEDFLRALQSRLNEILSRPRNRVTFVGPVALEPFFRERLAGTARLRFRSQLGFGEFEAAVRAATVVGYWNVLSASLLYCLYCGVAPIFFGRGHQVRVCEGLYEHAVAHVYCGQPPGQLDLAAPIAADPEALVRERGIRPWLRYLGAQYARGLAPDRVVERLVAERAS